MTPNEWIQLAIFAALVATVVANARMMKKQAEAQNLMALTTLLVSDDARRARATVLTRLKENGNPEQWLPSVADDAAQVTSIYTCVGMAVKAELVERGPVLETWGRSIRDCHDILKPYIDKRRADAGGDQHYLESFDWLAAQARNHHED